MNKRSTGVLARVLMFAMLAFVALPTATFAQGGYQNNGRWSREEQRRWEREQRRNRNDDQWGNRNDQYRNGRYGNDGYGNYGGSFNLRQTALNAGFADGVKAGRKDRSHGDRFDFQDEGAFQKATRDYSSRLGDRELYRQYYREGFDHGYRDGYSGY